MEYKIYGNQPPSYVKMEKITFNIGVINKFYKKYDIILDQLGSLRIWILKYPWWLVMIKLQGLILEPFKDEGKYK